MPKVHSQIHFSLRAEILCLLDFVCMNLLDFYDRYPSISLNESSIIHDSSSSYIFRFGRNLFYFYSYIRLFEKKLILEVYYDRKSHLKAKSRILDFQYLSWISHPSRF